MQQIDNNQLHRWYYHSPIGQLLLFMDDDALYGTWFVDQKHYPNWTDHYDIGETRLTKYVEQWLDRYFNGEPMKMDIPCHPVGTAFQQDIWNILLTIPYGSTMTYGEIAEIYKTQHGLTSMSAQAVGQAVGHNPIGILIPCHRVLGKARKLTGYAGGIERKAYLLDLEGIKYQKEKHG